MSEPTAKRQKTAGTLSENASYNCVDEIKIDISPMVLGSGSNSQGILSTFCHPLTVSEFLSKNWKKRAFVTHGNVSRFSMMISEHLSDLDLMELLQQTPSEEIHAWLKDLGKTEALESITVDNPHTAHILHRSGASLYFRAPQELSDALVTPFQRELGLNFAGVFPDGDNKGEIETFISKKGHVTDWHFDFMENFTFQLSGIKRWKLKPGPPSPIRGCTPHYKEEVGVIEMQAKIHKLRSINQSCPFQQQVKDPETFDEIVLYPGDCFYFPAGMWHRVECVEDSISINVSLKTLCWADIVSSAVRQVLWQDDSFRQGICTTTPQKAQDHLRNLLHKLPDIVKNKLTSDSILPKQMLTPYAANIAQEYLVKPKENHCNADMKDNVVINDGEAEVEEEVVIEVSGRSLGGPSFGGVRQFELFGTHSAAENEILSSMRKEVDQSSKNIHFRKNPLAVLISSNEVPGLGETSDTSDIVSSRTNNQCNDKKVVFALHVNFGNDDAQSLHQTIISDESNMGVATTILMRLQNILTKEPDFDFDIPTFATLFMESDDCVTPEFCKLLILELVYIGYLIRK